MDIVYNDARVIFGDFSFRAAAGAGGVLEAALKQEGDGVTPAGRFQLREVFYRADLINALKTALPHRKLERNDGWCDDPGDPNYNKLVKLPYKASHEELWRDDEVYDIIVPLGYNDDPPVPGKGSAIFIHVARPGYPPTDGCVTLTKDDLSKLLEKVLAEVFISIS